MKAEYFGLVVVISLFVLTVIWQWFQSRGGWAMLLRRHTPVLSAKNGQRVRVRGVVQSLETLRAPLSGRVCSAYTLKVLQTDDSVEDSKTMMVHQEQHQVDFQLVDEAGSLAYVSAAHSKLLLMSMLKRVEKGSPEAEKLKSLLERVGVEFNSGMRFAVEEGVLEDGEVADVLGLATWEPDPDGAAAHEGYRETKRAERLRLSAGDDELVIRDTDL